MQLMSRTAYNKMHFVRCHRPSHSRQVRRGSHGPLLTSQTCQTPRAVPLLGASLLPKEIVSSEGGTEQLTFSFLKAFGFCVQVLCSYGRTTRNALGSRSPSVYSTGKPHCSFRFCPALSLSLPLSPSHHELVYSVRHAQSLSFLPADTCKQQVKAIGRSEHARANKNF